MLARKTFLGFTTLSLLIFPVAVFATPAEVERERDVSYRELVRDECTSYRRMMYRRMSVITPSGIRHYSEADRMNEKTYCDDRLSRLTHETSFDTRSHETPHTIIGSNISSNIEITPGDGVQENEHETEHSVEHL